MLMLSSSWDNWVGEWHQMAGEARHRPFPKEGSRYPSALCSKDDLANSPGEVPTAASQGRFPGPQTHLRHPCAQGYLL